MTRRRDKAIAFLLLLPFLAIYGLAFVYPTADMVWLSLHKAPLVGAGEWAGIDNYLRLAGDRLFRIATRNTLWFVLLTAPVSVALALLIAMAVARLRGWLQAAVLACFFLPFMLPVSVVYLIWNWILDTHFGIAQPIVAAIAGRPVSIFRDVATFMPGVAFVTIWATIGFSVLLFLAGLRNIPQETYEAARLDGAGRIALFRHVTWPLIWPVTALVLTIQLISHLKVFDIVYLFNLRGRVDETMSLVQYVFRLAFQQNDGGYAATVAVAIFVLISVLSVLQFQLLRSRGR